MLDNTNEPVELNTDTTVDEGNPEVDANPNQEPADNPEPVQEPVKELDLSASIPEEPKTRKERNYESSFEKLVSDGEIDDSAFLEYHEKNPKGAERFLKQFNRKEGTNFELEDYVTVEPKNEDTQWLKEFRQQTEAQQQEAEKQKATDLLDGLIKEADLGSQWGEISPEFLKEAQELVDSGFSQAQAIEKAWKIAVAPVVLQKQLKADDRKKGREATTLEAPNDKVDPSFKPERMMTRDEYMSYFSDTSNKERMKEKDAYDAARTRRNEPTVKG